jgi:quercetin dioxygenase-like cupin family protein
MQLTRSADIPAQVSPGFELRFVGTPDTGASECLLLRGIVSPGGIFPPHSHDREEVLYFLSGSGTYTIGDDSGSISAGDVVVIPAGALHSFEVTETLDALGALHAGTKTFAADGTEMTL